VPAVALSSWRYPFARLAIEHDLDSKVRVVAHNPDFEQERFLSDIVLREHYRMEPEFMACVDAVPEELLDADADARLLVGSDVPTMSLGGHVLDMGQEWFELTGYPMTWGLFAARKGELDASRIRAIRDAVLASERQKRVWLRARETSEPLYAFYADELRFRLDDLCVAGLTELRQYLFYYEEAEEVRDIPFVFLSDEESETDEGSRPIL
jgi:predicted solute-binding protein